MNVKEKIIPAFLSDGGKMGELIRSFDWSKTAVGSPDTWPQSLRIAVRIMLDCPFGMYIAWGKEYIQLYNDGYRPILGITKHPQALGIGTRKTFEEIWDTIGPMFEGVMQGTPVGYPDFILHMDRNGYLEECVFDFSYSPIRLEDGEVGGVLVTVIETTEKVKNLKKLAESNDQLNFAIEAAELGTWDFNPLTYNFTGNNRLKDWFGLPHQSEIDLSRAIEVMIETDRSRVSNAIQKALQYESGGLYDIEYVIINPVTKQERIVRAKGRAWFGDDKTAYRFNGTLQDITKETIARKKIEESEHRFRFVLEQSLDPILILKGENLILEIANEPLFNLWGVDKSALGKPFLEILPEMKEQGFFDMLQDVYFTGKIIKGIETPVLFIRPDGKKETIYFNFTYQPYREKDGKITGVLVTASDVTKEVVAKKQIEESEQALKRYKHMADNANEPFILMRQDGTFAYLNDLALQRWGYTKEEAEHIRVPDVDPIYNDETFNAAFTAAQNEKIPQFETLHKKKDGTIYPVEINMGGLSLEGKPYMFAIARDITERKKLEDAVRESEEKIRSFILQAPVAMCLYRGPQYIIEIVNEELLAIWDKSLESVINKPVFEALPAAKGQGFEALLEKVYKTGEKFDAFGVPITLTRNGKLKTIYVNLVYQAYREADGSISGIVEVVSDVTEQVVATRQIEASENQFRIFADSIQNLAWIANGDGSIYWYNQQWYYFTGTTFEEMEGWGWQKVHHPDYVDNVVEYVKEAWKKDIAFELTFPLRRHDGKYHWFLTRAYPVKDANGNIERWIGTNTDITEQKSFTEELETKVNERTEQLQLQNQTFELAESIAQFGSYRWNIVTGALVYSDNLFRLLDCEPGEFVPSFEKFLSFIHPDDLQQVIRNGEQTMITGELVETPYRIISKSGAIKYLRSSGKFSGEGVNRLLIGTVQDISKDVAASKELQSKNIELENSNAELNSFSYIASHDLKEPLRKIQTFSRRIIEIENFSNKTQDYFNRIISAAERMQNLIDSLLNFSRTNSIELIFELCDLNHILEESKSDLHESILEKEAVIEAEHLPTIHGVSIQLTQLITNLLDNAIKYSRPEVMPHIKITSSIVQGKIIDHPSANNQIDYHAIKFADNGIGFENQYSNKMFELFQRLHGRNEYSGTGIGLSIVKKIAINHRGFIVAEGQTGIGSTFTIYVPTT